MTPSLHGKSHQTVSTAWTKARNVCRGPFVEGPSCLWYQLDWWPLQTELWNPRRHGGYSALDRYSTIWRACSVGWKIAVKRPEARGVSYSPAKIGKMHIACPTFYSKKVRNVRPFNSSLLTQSRRLCPSPRTGSSRYWKAHEAVFFAFSCGFSSVHS